jgi:ABC-type multidrug transport system fused ATPase/permease subunit
LIELKYLEIIENRIKSYWGKYEENELHLIEESKKEILEKSPIILERTNLVFVKWKTYWLVGKNWAWKTTLTSLLFNSFDNYTWKIFIDSKELREFKRDFFNDNISLVSQIPYVIEWLTIRENLLLWVNKKYEDEYILSLLDKFWLKKKILKNRKWLDVRLWYDNNFSWWEKQLIVLIRTILQDKKVIIMDEWTNQLDAENELLVMSELLKYKHDKIIIFITHRMTTIRKSDLIYCLENWQITDYWNHKTLLSRDNIYSKFWRKQVGE